MSETFLNQFIVGTLLGDSYVSKDGRFGFSHSTVQADYFHHKVNILREYGIAPKIQEYRTKGNRIGKWDVKPTDVLQARVSLGKRCKELRNVWYPHGIKVVPTDIVLDEVALAYWYMDDGSVNKRTKFVDNRSRRTTRVGGPWVNQFRLHLDGFDQTSQELLQTKLGELGVESWFYTKKNNGKRNLIISKDVAKATFKELVKPTIDTVPAMHYKIDLETSFKL